MKKDNNEIISWLETWYKQYCNGDWEHNENIKIYTIDNPGWRVTIDLTGTHCEEEFFNSLEKEISDKDWFHCFLRDGKFEGAGGPNNLIDILTVFKNWAIECQKNKLAKD